MHIAASNGSTDVDTMRFMFAMSFLVGVYYTILLHAAA
jgi:hypothetical protein